MDSVVYINYFFKRTLFLSSYFICWEEKMLSIWTNELI